MLYCTPSLSLPSPPSPPPSPPLPSLPSPQVFSVRVRVDSDYVLGLLLERGLFAIARRYAAIVGSTASQVTIKEAEHNLRKISQSSYWKYEQARLHFWHQCNSTFHAARVDPESAAEFYEVNLVLCSLYIIMYILWTVSCKKIVDYRPRFSSSFFPYSQLLTGRCYEPEVCAIQLL